MIPDSSTRYGSFSRFLHWIMAAGIGWVLFSGIVHLLAKDSGLDAITWPTHKHIGSLMMALVVVRAAWALAHLRQRPPELNLASTLGHVALYALMIAVPLIGLLRQYGSARAFSPLGLPVFPGRSDDAKVQWLIDLGGNWHGELGWALLALVLGHVIMAVLHRRSPASNVLARMWG